MEKTRVKCTRCLKDYATKKNGEMRAHPCFDASPLDVAADAGASLLELMTMAVLVSDLTPTVEPMDDKTSYASAPCGIQECCGDDEPDKGPWFGAMYDGKCSVNECDITEGDRIRADGQGGYECEDCGDESLGAGVDWKAPAEPPLREVTTVELPTADEFLSPTAVDELVEEFNVSGQPKARYEWRGSQNLGYLTTDPGTGDFRRYKNGKPKGWTRATTFNKAASDSKAINDWGKRNIVIGASRRRDVLLRAHGLTHENRRELEGIVAELEEAAGAKVGSDLGTYLHSFTELMDAGLKTWIDAPAEFQNSLAMYGDELRKAGLEPVPGLIERTTMIREFGGVVGTFDRIFYHRPSGTYMIGDLKTGKTMEYAMDETNTQMWTYAHGVNQNGIYDWNTDTWGAAFNGCDCVNHISNEDCRGPRFITVREDVGVIIHMPVQGPQAGTVQLVHADLAAGAKHAELCHAIRSRAKSKVRAFTPPGPIDFTQPLPETWEDRFAGVRTGEEATALWRQAKAAGIAGIELNELIELAREALRSKG